MSFMTPTQAKRKRSTPSEGSLSPEEARAGLLVGSTHQAAPRAPRSGYGATQGTLTWLEGQLLDGSWHGLYCSRIEQVVRSWHRIIIGRGEDDPDVIKEGLNVYVDFRVRSEAE